LSVTEQQAMPTSTKAVSDNHDLLIAAYNTLTDATREKFHKNSTILIHKFKKFQGVG